MNNMAGSGTQDDMEEFDDSDIDTQQDDDMQPNSNSGFTLMTQP